MGPSLRTVREAPPRVAFVIISVAGIYSRFDDHDLAALMRGAVRVPGFVPGESGFRYRAGQEARDRGPAAR
ncbi:MAG TPA: hypothetical protein VJT49_31725 [Amycolatopsis sp.]|uniref:hypothetical protein n=1 Tax=Amycolatopsis sp. TaxID=37632 RepID=UPI002B49B58C|nr:hypothetical protein [Amycolatopsis sp.]HKS49602.1 hypothetical protein [Amycolatopsis sp.]